MCLNVGRLRILLKGLWACGIIRFQVIDGDRFKIIGFKVISIQSIDDVQYSGFICCCSQGLADNCVVAKVNGDVWDLDRPLENDCELRLVKFDDPDGVFVVPLCFEHCCLLQ